MNTVNNQKIQDAYAAAHAEAMSYFEIIAARIEDAQAPGDETNWSDVANMAHLVDQLRQVVGEPE